MTIDNEEATLDAPAVASTAEPRKPDPAAVADLVYKSKVVFRQRLATVKPIARKLRRGQKIATAR
jgi:hypothetical protein